MLLAGTEPASIAQAVQALLAGQVIGLPTETVYGLAADAENSKAVARIFEAKGRPADHPLIVHVPDMAAVAHFASSVCDFAAALMQAFWPGPLTLILPRRDHVAETACAGQRTIGLRCPSHPVAQALLRALAQAAPQGDATLVRVVRGLAAPSANRFGRVSPTTAAHVCEEFGDGLLVLDGGPCQVGIESTIVDCSRGQPVLLRPGAITREQLQAVCGEPVRLPDEMDQDAAPTPKASGTLASHYAPRARVRLLTPAELQLALQTRRQTASRVPVALWWRTLPLPPDSAGLTVQAMPQAADACAHDLFARLRAFDAQGVEEIWVESPPDGMAWDGVRDRLRRAAH